MYSTKPVSGAWMFRKRAGVRFVNAWTVPGGAKTYVRGPATAVAPNSLFLANATVGGNLTYTAALPPPFTLNSMTFSNVAVQGSSRSPAASGSYPMPVCSSWE